MTWNQLAQTVLDLDTNDVSAETFAAAGRTVLDWFGCTLAPYRTQAGNLSTPVRPAQTGALLRLLAAANCGPYDALGRNDLAVGRTVVPAALIAATDKGASGAALLAAIIAGYEVAARLDAAEEVATCASHDWNARAESCAAAGTAARIMGLNHAATAKVLARAWAEPTPRPILRDVLEAWEADADTAESAVFYGGPAVESCAGDAAGAALTRRRLRLHAAAPEIHVILDAALAIKEAHRLHPEDLEAIVIGVPQKVAESHCGDFESRPLPANIPFCLAVAFLTGRVAGSDLKPQNLLKAPIGWVMSNVSVRDGSAAGRRSSARCRPHPLWRRP